jgi:hypothetical protein
VWSACDGLGILVGQQHVILRGPRIFDVYHAERDSPSQIFGPATLVPELSLAEDDIGLSLSRSEPASLNCVSRGRASR